MNSVCNCIKRTLLEHLFVASLLCYCWSILLNTLMSPLSLLFVFVHEIDLVFLFIIVIIFLKFYLLLPFLFITPNHCTCYICFLSPFKYNAEHVLYVGFIFYVIRDCHKISLLQLANSLTSIPPEFNRKPIA